MPSKFTVLQDGVPMFTGTRTQISNKFYMDPNYLYKLVETGGLYLGKYQIIKYVFERKPPKKKEKKKESVLDYLYWHLKYMGITNLNEDPQKYIEPLAELGLEGVTYREYRTGKDKDFILEWKGK